MSKRKANSDVHAAVQKKRVVKTLKDKILDLVQNAEAFVSLVALKKTLAEQYEVPDTSANNTKILKTLKALLEENRNDFGKIGGSYHGGVNSLAYERHEAMRKRADAENAEAEAVAK